MATYLVVLDLRQSGPVYKKFEETLRRFDGAWVTPTAWLITSDLKAATLGDELSTWLGPHDSLLLTPVTPEVVTRNLRAAVREVLAEVSARPETKPPQGGLPKPSPVADSDIAWQ